MLREYKQISTTLQISISGLWYRIPITIRITIIKIPEMSNDKSFTEVSSETTVNIMAYFEFNACSITF